MLGLGCRDRHDTLQPDALLSSRKSNKQTPEQLCSRALSVLVQPNRFLVTKLPPPLGEQHKELHLVNLRAPTDTDKQPRHQPQCATALLIAWLLAKSFFLSPEDSCLLTAFRQQQQQFLQLTSAQQSSFRKENQNIIKSY